MVLPISFGISLPDITWAIEESKVVNLRGKFEFELIVLRSNACPLTKTGGANVTVCDPFCLFTSKVYVFTVLPSSAVTIVVMALAPTFNNILFVALPDCIVVLLIVIVAFGPVWVGVMVKLFTL